MGFCGGYGVEGMGTHFWKGYARADRKVRCTWKIDGWTCSCFVPEANRLRMGSHYLFTVLYYYYALQHTQRFFKNYFRYVLYRWLKCPSFADHKNDENAIVKNFGYKWLKLTYELF